LYSFFHPQFFVFGIFVFLGVAIFKMKVFLGNKFQNIILASTLLFALFLGGIPFQHKRLLLSTFPLVILFLYPVMKNIFTVIGNKTIPNNFVNLSVTNDKPHNNSSILANVIKYPEAAIPSEKTFIWPVNAGSSAK
jgi:hypothetical protein